MFFPPCLGSDPTTRLMLAFYIKIQKVTKLHLIGPHGLLMMPEGILNEVWSD